MLCREVWRHSHGWRVADSLDVVLSYVLIRTRRQPPEGKSCDSASLLRIHTQKIIKNDRSRVVRLSKTAHK